MKPSTCMSYAIADPSYPLSANLVVRSVETRGRAIAPDSSMIQYDQDGEKAIAVNEERGAIANIRKDDRRNHNW
jgi:hypothetical protein